MRIHKGHDNIDHTCYNHRSRNRVSRAANSRKVNVHRVHYALEVEGDFDVQDLGT